jgi:hypothetical protein
MKLALALMVGAAGALAACADYYPPPPPPPPVAVAVVAPPMTDSCFRTSEIANHTIGDDNTLYVRVGLADVYRLEMSNACLAGANSTDPLVMRQPPGAALACAPIDLDVSIRKGGLAPGAISTPCIVRSIVRMTSSEVAALPSRLRP